MQIKRIIVDEIPQNCGDCHFAQKPDWSESFYCGGITDFGKNTIVGSPCLMTYRRSDCPLEVEEDD